MRQFLLILLMSVLPLHSMAAMAMKLGMNTNAANATNSAPPRGKAQELKYSASTMPCHGVAASNAQDIADKNAAISSTDSVKNCCASESICAAVCAMLGSAAQALVNARLPLITLEHGQSLPGFYSPHYRNAPVAQLSKPPIAG